MRLALRRRLLLPLLLVSSACTQRDSTEFRHPVELIAYEEVIVIEGEEAIQQVPQRMAVESPNNTAYVYVATNLGTSRLQGLSENEICFFAYCTNVVFTDVVVHDGDLILSVKDGRICQGNTQPGGIFLVKDDDSCFTQHNDGVAPTDDAVGPTANFLFEGDPQRMAIDAKETLYWTTDESAYDLAEATMMTSEATEHIIEAPQPPLAITVNDNEVAYVTTANPEQSQCSEGELWEFTRGNEDSAKQIKHIKPSCAVDIVYAAGAGGVDDALFWVDVAAGEVRRASPNGTGESVVANGFAQPIVVAADNDHAYWLDRGTVGASDGALWRYDRRSAEIEQLADGLDAPVDMAIEGDLIYWIEQGNANRVMTLAK